jgi:PBSX family phage terminase large subunit
MQCSVQTIGKMTKTEIIAPYEPLDWQLAPLRDKSLVMLLTGSAGGGKSRLAAEKIHAYCLRYPGATAICLRKAREYASKSVVFALKRVIGDDPSVTYNASELVFRYGNGSIIFIAGMKDEGQQQALRSINGDGSADIIWGEEANALTETDHNELLARLRGTAASWRQIIYTTNPDTPTHWIKQRLMDGGQASVYFSKAKDNPHNPPGYLTILDMLTGPLGLRLRDGKWVQAEGVVYENFDDSIHIITPFPIPADWRRIRVVDFGYTNPFVCQWWAIDGDGRMYLYREIYHTRRTVKVHAGQINALSTGELIEATVADHDAEDRATMAENGIYTIPATKDISRGLQAVGERLKVAGDGKPRLFVFNNALVEIDSTLDDGKKPTCTAQEFSGYIWPKTADGKPLKEVPVKENDHGLDALRYAVMYVDTSGPAQTADSPW